MARLAGWRPATAAALLMGSMLWATDKGPDGGNYTATNNTVYTFLDPAGGGSSPSVLTGAELGEAPLSLPFQFRFYGKLYNTVCASSSGVLHFAPDANTCNAQALLVDFANTDLTSTPPTANLPAIAPFWMDLTLSNGAVYYQTLGTTGNRQFIIEWYNALPAGSLSPVTFEVVLFEATNNVLFQYQTVVQGALATVGISDAADLSGTGARTDTRDLQWSYNAPVLANSTAILFAAPSTTATSVNTIDTSPSGLGVFIDGASTATATPKVVSWAPGDAHTMEVAASQTNGGTKTAFNHWSTTGATPKITVTAQAAGTTYTAVFDTQYYLTLSSADTSKGTVGASDGTLSGSTFFPAGDSVQVTAAPVSPYVFKNFSGDLSGTTTPQSITMDGPKSVVANFGAAYSPCDINLSGAITPDDIAAIATEVSKNQLNHDLNSDQAENVIDIQIVINAYLSPTHTCATQ